jgi:ATP-dependent DNA helicase DinG
VSEVSDSSKTAIREAYNALMAARQLAPRWGQRQMIAEVANTLARVDENGGAADPPAIAAIEAGTGTGKTIAYSLPGVVMAQALGKRLVIATATVALQEQLAGRDLPDLQAGSGLDFDFAVAKGRRRYLCLSQLDRLLAGAPGNPESAGGNPGLYPDEAFLAPDSQAATLYQSMLDAMGRGDWDGDRDSWAGNVDDAVWFPATADQGQCTGRRCPNIGQCSFFRARERLQNADVVVTNHDLVLSDLGLGGGVILPAPEDSIYVFDEAHHLPDKALAHFAAFCRVQPTLQWLGETRRALSRGAPLLATLPGCESGLETLDRLAAESAEALEVAGDTAAVLLEQGERGDRLRFEHGAVPEILRPLAETLASLSARLSARLNTLERAVEDALQDQAYAPQRDELEAWQMGLGGMVVRADNVLALWRSYVTDSEDENPPRARWLSRRDPEQPQALEFHCSHILAGELLAEVLWSRAAGAILTSATLTALGSFDRLRLRAGLPDTARCKVVASPFDYSRATLQVPAMTSEGGAPTAHTEELISLLPTLLDEGEGSLVLFSSRRQMLDVRDGLSRPWRERLLTQDDYGKQEVLRRHREAIDAGQGSVIFGLASFAEGVDLPGDYCRHVVIAKLPFAVPDDPVDAALAEWLESQGRNPFMEISVPDAALRLVQASGRLLRSESDEGRVTILDRRLLTRRYGRAILDSMPPFTRDLR